jgi:Ca2+-binding RTX toxin-like protein
MTVRKHGTVGYGGHDLDSLTYEPAQYISNAASDRIVAGNGPNELYGNNGNDTLLAKAGDDLLVGGAGIDSLYGGKGADYFVFDHAPTRTNIDHIKDFSAKQHDKIVLSYKYFKAVDLVIKQDASGHVEQDRRLDADIGHLSKEQFRIGGAALLDTDRILYNKATGALYYDADGSGAGAPVKIADLKHGTALSASDFLFF